jgi:hypothetical protein
MGALDRVQFFHDSDKEHILRLYVLRATYKIPSERHISKEFDSLMFVNGLINNQMILSMYKMIMINNQTNKF